MRIELDQALCQSFPALFSRRHGSDALMRYGFMVEDGWYALINVLCALLQHETDAKDAPQLVAVQVKEKFTELRFYVTGEPTERQRAFLHFARVLASQTCDTCGAPGDTWVRHQHYTVRCDRHRSPGAIRAPETPIGTTRLVAPDSPEQN